jgi:hypothetical protein
MQNNANNLYQRKIYETPLYGRVRSDNQDSDKGHYSMCWGCEGIRARQLRGKTTAQSGGSSISIFPLYRELTNIGVC